MISNFTVLKEPSVVGYVAALASALGFALVGMFASHLYALGFAPEQVLFFRFLFAVILLGLYLGVKHMNRLRENVGTVTLKSLLPSVMGLWGYGFSALLFFFAMQRIPTGLANLLLFQNPLIVCILGVVIHRVVLSAKEFVTLILCGLGLPLVCLPSGIAMDTWGLIAGLGAGILYGIYLFVSAGQAQREEPLVLTFKVLLGALVGIGGYVIARSSSFPNLAGSAWVYLVLLSTLCTVLPVVALFFAVRRIGVRRATLLSSIEPVLALFFGAVALHESLTPLQVVGAAFIVIGLLVLRGSRRMVSEVAGEEVNQPIKPSAKVINLAEALRSAAQNKAYWNGETVDLSSLRVSVEDRATLFGDAVYEVVRIYHGSPWLAEEHIDRLTQSLQKIRIVYDTTPLLSLMLANANLNRIDDGYIYVQISRGNAPRNHSFPENTKPNVLIFSKPLVVNPFAAFSRIGIAALLQPDIRWLGRDIKSVNLLPNCMAKQAADEVGAQEAIFVEDDGSVTEASSNNVFIVKNEKLITAPADQHILNGITRQYLIGIARDMGIVVEERKLSLTELLFADEVMITGSIAEVVAVRSINGKPVGLSERRIYQRLRERFSMDIARNHDLGTKERRRG